MAMSSTASSAPCRRSVMFSQLIKKEQRAHPQLFLFELTTFHKHLDCFLNHFIR